MYDAHQVLINSYRDFQKITSSQEQKFREYLYENKYKRTNFTRYATCVKRFVPACLTRNS